MIKKTEIIIFTKDKDIAYSPCAIPLVLGGCIKSFEDIIMHDSKYYQNKNIQILTVKFVHIVTFIKW